MKSLPLRKSTTTKKQNKNTFTLDFYPIVWYTYSMRITNKQITDFAETHDMVALAGDMFEDAGGNVIHESEVVDMLIDESGVLEW